MAQIKYSVYFSSDSLDSEEDSDEDPDEDEDELSLVSEDKEILRFLIISLSLTSKDLFLLISFVFFSYSGINPSNSFSSSAFK